eukprot:scaffold82088_cov33-Tisochrysis_lutea.AAC.1
MVPPGHMTQVACQPPYKRARSAAAPSSRQPGRRSGRQAARAAQEGRASCSLGRAAQNVSANRPASSAR